MALRKAPSAPASAIPCSRWGLTRRLFAPRKPLIFLPDCLPCGFLAECGPKGVQGGERKATLLASIDDNFAVSNSPWAGIDAPTPAREQGLQPYGALYCFEWRSEGDWGRAESPQCARRRIPLPCLRRGLTRRLRRGSGTCSPKGRSYFSFDGERKVCKRKPAARRYGKKAPIAHFDGGARNVARNGAG